MTIAMQMILDLERILSGKSRFSFGAFIYQGALTLKLLGTSRSREYRHLSFFI
jgi:hypothetical protein